MMQDREYEMAHPYYPRPISGYDIMDTFDKTFRSVDEFGKAMRANMRNGNRKSRGKRKR